MKEGSHLGRRLNDGAAAVRRAWLWFHTGPPYRGVAGLVIAEAVLTTAFIVTGESLRRTSDALYVYLFIILWAAFQWGFLHALLATALALTVGTLWVGPPYRTPGLEYAYNLWLWGFGFVALALSGIMAQVRLNQRILRSRYEVEHTVAVTVQRALLPQPSDVPGYDVAFHYHPAAREASVGGDFLDIWELADGRFGLLLGDVTGHGVEASVQTAEIRYSLRALAYHGLSPADCVATVNDILYHHRPSERFATMFLGILNSQTHVLEFVNAGQNPPLLWHADGTVEWLARTGTLLGIVPSSQFGYQSDTCILEAGDGILLYTDGVTEARRGEEFFGPERLQEVVLEERSVPAAAALASLHGRVQEFTGGESSDDVAALCLKRRTESDEPGRSRAYPAESDGAGPEAGLDRSGRS